MANYGDKMGCPRSDDDGKSFWYLSRVPCNSGSMSPYCERRIGGPSEPTIAQLADGRLLLLFRTTGTPCFKAYSRDGVNWTEPVMMGPSVDKSPVWTVWPQLEVLSNGVLVATSGRPGLGLWWSTSSGNDWTFQNLAGVHNRLLPDQPTWHYDLLEVDCDYYGCNSCWMPSQHCARQTTSYTGIASNIAESADGRNVTILISYDRLANGWFGPPGMNGKVDQVFAMKVHVDLSDTPVPPPPPPPNPVPPPTPPKPPPTPPPPPGPQAIQIVTVQYGANCNISRAGDYRCDLEGNIPTAAHCPSAIRSRCNGKPRCNFTVLTPLLDPCPFRDKHFSVTFRCDNTQNSPIHNNTLDGEASGHPLFMACA
jgi:hypothetical protein